MISLLTKWPASSGVNDVETQLHQLNRIAQLSLGLKPGANKLANDHRITFWNQFYQSVRRLKLHNYLFLLNYPQSHFSLKV